MSIPTVNTPQILHLSARATAEQPAVRIGTILDASRGVYVNASITVEHPAVPVTPTRLAKMRLGGLRRDLLREALAKENPGLTDNAAVKTYFKGTNGRPVAEKVRANPTFDHLQTAALIHRLARLVGDYPVLAIARSFGLEAGEARHWVSQARKGGAI